MKNLLPIFSLLILLGCSKDDLTDNAGIFSDLRDGHEYQWVRIGTQTWMAENLAYLPDLEEMLPLSLKNPYYFVYDFNGKLTNDAKNTQNYSRYGVVYNLPASKDSVCPDGWHVPSGSEWTSLIEFIGKNSASKLKAPDGWGSENSGLNTGRCGFDALPGGYWQYASSPGGFAYNRSEHMYEIAEFWTSEGNPNWRLDISSVEAMEIKSDYYKYQGRSVRCIKDE